MLTADAEPLCEGGSDDSDSGYGTSVRASQWPLPSQQTTQPNGDRRRQGPGSGFEVKRTAKFRKHVPEAPTPQEPGTRYFNLDDNESVPELGGSRPDRLSAVSGPQERVPRYIVDIAPVVQLLHVPVPHQGDSVVEVLKILDKSLPDVEQIIEVPKILQHTVLQRSSLQEPQMVNQLVTVPTNPDTVLCVFTRSPAPPMENQLVEVPPVVPQLVGFFRG